MAINVVKSNETEEAITAEHIEASNADVIAKFADTAKSIEASNADELSKFADLLEPIAVIFGDKELKDVYKSGNLIAVVQAMLKRHPKEVVQALAILDGADPAFYKVNLLTVPAKIISLFNQPGVEDLFR